MYTKCCMESAIIRHPPRHFDFTLLRSQEMESECPEGPADQPHVAAKCPDCDASMVYRGIGKLRSGTRVHYFECVHSPREVHSVSLVIAD